VDLERNLLWYRVPSLGAVVFFRWEEAPECTIYEKDRFSASPTSYESAGDRFLFEHDVDGTGQLVDIDQEDEVLEKLFTIVPCTHIESQEFYNELVGPEGRELLQEEFMEAIGAHQEDQGEEYSQMEARYTFSDDEGILTPEEELSWLQDLEKMAASDEENDPSPSLPSTPVSSILYLRGETDHSSPLSLKVNRAKTSLPDEGGYDSDGSNDSIWFKVRVGGRLRNQSSLGDLTPTACPMTMPIVERTGSPSGRRVSN
jgi:hypothetical protein